MARLNVRQAKQAPETISKHATRSRASMLRDQELACYEFKSKHATRSTASMLRVQLQACYEFKCTCASRLFGTQAVTRPRLG